MKAVQTIVIENKEYVILPKADYLRLSERQDAFPGETPAIVPAPTTPQRGREAATVDAIAYANATLAANLRRARETAGLTQEQLAKRLGKSQAMVSGAEGGRVRVSTRYVAAVVKACGLPEGWPSPPAKKPRRRSTAP
jgi:ribosome-binding protein aMBF1 (putative translation factor)